MKDVGPGLTLWLVRESASLPVDPTPCLLLVLNGVGRLHLHRQEVLLSPGVVLTVPGSDRVDVVPSADEPIILLRHLEHASDVAVPADPHGPEPRADSLAQGAVPAFAQAPVPQGAGQEPGEVRSGTRSDDHPAGPDAVPTRSPIVSDAPEPAAASIPPGPPRAAPAPVDGVAPAVEEDRAEALGPLSDARPPAPFDLRSWLRTRRSGGEPSPSSALVSPPPALSEGDAPARAPSDLASWLRVRREARTRVTEPPEA